MAQDIEGGRYEIDFTGALQGFDSLGKADELMREGLKQSGIVADKAFAQAANAAKQYENRLDAILVETRQSGVATQRFASEVAGLVKEIRDAAAAQDASRKAAAAAADERRKATAAAREAAKAEKQASREAAAAAKAAADAAKESTGLFGGLIAKVSGKLSGGNIFNSILSSATAAGAGIFAFGAFYDKVKEGLKDFQALSGVQATLKAVAGSAAAGAQEFIYIKDKANELGLELIPTAKAYAGLFAAAKEANIPVAQTRTIFEGVTSAAKVLNLTADDTNGVLLALQQIVSKGTVSSEELRGQIGERLPGAFGLAAKAMGLTTAELGKQLQAGKVLSADFLPKFAAQLKATYGDATAEAATQVGSNMGRIATYFQESSARIGQFFAPLVAMIAQTVAASKTAGQVAQESSSAYFKQAEATKQLVPGLQKLLNGYDSLNTMSDRSVTEQKELERTIQQLAKAVPGAVTEFDKYGKALGINGDAVKQFIKDQQNLVRYLNTDAREKNSTALVGLIAEQEKYQRLLAANTTKVNGLTRRTVAEFDSGGGEVRVLSQAESDKITSELTGKLARVQDDIRANLENRQLLRGKSPLLPTGDDAANDKAIQGLIEKQEQLIKELKERQKKAANENAGDGADFLFGKGGLNKQLDIAEKELERLQGKVTKTKAVVDKLTPALRALAEERDRLTETAAKAITKESDDASQRARLSFETALRAADKIEAELKRREAAVRKAGGKGGNADGVVDGVQAQQLTALRLAALDAYYTELYKITEAREQRLFDLRADSDEKEVEAINRKYDRLIQVAKDNIERQAIEEARQREQLALKAAQEDKRIQLQQAAASAAASLVGETFGTGTGISFYDAKRAAEKANLEAERKAAQDSLNNTLNKVGREAEIERAALQARLAQIKNAIGEIDRAKKVSAPEDFLYKLVLGENDSPENREALDAVVAQGIQAITSIVDAQAQAAQNRAAAATQNINELQSSLAAEIQLNKDGSASNIAGIREQIAQERQIRREALEDQRKAAKQKVLIDTLTQASSLATAVANIFAVTAELNVVPGVGLAIGLALSAAMVGAFAASKIQAFQAADSIGKSGGGFFKGGYTGGSDTREERGPVHGKEFVFTAEKTQQHREFFELLHAGKPLNAAAVESIAPLLPDYELPAKLQAERAAAQVHLHQHSFAPMKEKFDAMQSELAGIKEHVSRISGETIVPLGPNRTLTKQHDTGSIKIENL